MLKSLNSLGYACLAFAFFILFPGCSAKPKDGFRLVERTMTVTAYCPCKKCCDWDRTWKGQPVFAAGGQKGRPKEIGITANGSMARRGTIAADPSIPFGTHMHVPGYGNGIVKDRGGAIRGNHIDLYFQSHSQALKWGTQKLEVKIWLPE